MSKIRMALAAAAFGFGALTAGQGSVQAASVQMTPLPSIAATAPVAGGLLLKADWDDFCYRHPYSWRCRHHVRYNHCYRWRHECGERWGWRTHRFYVCARRHGC